MYLIYYKESRCYSTYSQIPQILVAPTLTLKDRNSTNALYITLENVL